MRPTNRNRLLAVAAASTLVAGGAVVQACGDSNGEQAAGAPTETVTEEIPATGGTAGSGATPSPAGVGSPTDQEIARARRAGLAESGGGEILSVDRDDDGGYDVDILNGDQEISVDLDAAFRVVGTETEQSDQATGSDLTRAREAALAESGGGEVLSVDRDDDGGYDVDIVKGAQEISVDLDAGFQVIGTETETGED